MALLYSMQIQLGLGKEISEDFVDSAKKAFGFTTFEIDDNYMMEAVFESEVKPSEMDRKAAEFICQHPEINYIDVMYRWPAEMVADRFVAWWDGNIVHYTGRLTFEEDK